VTGLIDHAPTFPPAALDTARAVAAHRAARQSPDRGALACLVWPSEQLPQLTAAAGPVPAGGWAVSAVAPRREDQPPKDWLATVRTAASSAATEGVDLYAVEVLAPYLGSAASEVDAAVAAIVLATESRSSDYRLVLELPLPGRGHSAGVEALAAAAAATTAQAQGRLLLKVRTGGTGPGAAPPARSLAAFVAAAAAAEVPFKATAGLHHALPTATASPGAQHGLMNLLVASVLAHLGADAALLQRVLEEQEPAAFDVRPEDGVTWRGHRATWADVAAARRNLFTSVGSCSFSEPIASLRSRGYLRRPDGSGAS
jgi:hypothetical protein